MVLSGGYDSRYDNDSATLSSLAGNVLGNHIYIVDAETGDLLWSAGKTDPGVAGDEFLPCNGLVGSGSHVCSDAMEHSFAAEPQTADIDGDGAIDLMFAVDLAGNVWRFDFRTSKSDVDGKLTLDSSAGGIIASLAESGANRRFYNRPEAVLVLKGAQATVNGVKKTATKTRLNIIVGSGYRANPKVSEAGGNRFYVVFDENLLTPDFDTGGKVNYKYAGSTVSNVAIQASDIKAITTSVPLDPINIHKHGFYVAVDDSSYEKIINRTITFNYLVVGTSYVPAAAAGGSTANCGLGTSKVYTFNLLEGAVKQSFPIETPGLPSDPVIIKDENGKNICFGTTCVTVSQPRSEDFCAKNPGHPDCGCGVGGNEPCPCSNSDTTKICDENGSAGVVRKSWWEENRDN
jgi:type IV pilus assembly protein PilY1